MKKSMAWLTTSALLSGCVAGTVAMAAPASAATRADMRGTITVTETADYSNEPGHFYHLRTMMQVALPGTLQQSTGQDTWTTDAAPITALEFERNATNWDYDNERWCPVSSRYVGWQPGLNETGPNYPYPTMGVSIGSTGLDQLAGKAKLDVSFYDSAFGFPKVSTTYCDGSSMEDQWRWIIDKHDQFAPYNYGLMGSWEVDNTPSNRLLSPQWIQFKKVGSQWRSQGSRTVDWGAYHMTVAWNLVSDAPSNQCVVPKAKKVKNMTVKQAKKIVKKAGFKPGKTLRSSQASRKIKHGRVFALQAKMFGTEAPCGSKVHMYVRK